MIHIKQGLLFTMAGIVFAQMLYKFLEWINRGEQDNVNN